MADENKNSGFWDIMKDGRSFIVIIVLIVLFILITSGILAPIVQHFGVEDNNIIITFIGVLATFVVVGNFAQVSEIRHRMEQDLEQKKEDIIKAQIDIATLKDKLGEVKTALTSHEENRQNDINNLKQYSQTQVKNLETQIEQKVEAHKSQISEALGKQRGAIEDYKWYVVVFGATLYGDTDDVIQLLLKLNTHTKESLFRLDLREGEPVNANVYISDNEITFYYEGKYIENELIIAVDGIKISAQSLFHLYQLYEDAVIMGNLKEYSDKGDVQTDDDKSQDEVDETSFKADNK